MTRLGVVTGLAAEAAVLTRARRPDDRPQPAIEISGADAVRARQAAERLILDGAKALLSFGIAGGLSPDVRPGTLIVADRIIVPGGAPIETAAAWRDALLDALRVEGIPCRAAAIAGRDAAVTTPAAKRRLYTDSGAEAVDMESHAVATVAHASGLPFIAVRAVADPQERALPEWTLEATGAAGRVRFGPVAAALCRRPWEIPALCRIAGDTRKALAALGRAAGLDALIFPGIG